jgi:hypothetical protein
MCLLVGCCRHHLIPKSTHPYWVKKGLDRKFLLSHTVDICRECHNAIHRLIDEETMGHSYRTLDALLAHEGVRKHAQWASKQKITVVKPGTNLKYRK